MKRRSVLEAIWVFAAGAVSGIGLANVRDDRRRKRESGEWIELPILADYRHDHQVGVVRVRADALTSPELVMALGYEFDRTDLAQPVVGYDQLKSWTPICFGLFPQSALAPPGSELVRYVEQRGPRAPGGHRR
jgi:hypothetical protein